jgi:hypothetical protein
MQIFIPQVGYKHSVRLSVAKLFELGAYTSKTAKTTCTIRDRVLGIKNLQKSNRI